MRVSLMTPRPGQHHEATRLLARIIAFCSQQRGFRGGQIVGGPAGSGSRRIGRVTLWNDRANADRTARDDHMLALRSQLDALVEPVSHLELGLDAVALTGEPGAAPGIAAQDAVAIAEGLARPRGRSVS